MVSTSPSCTTQTVSARDVLLFVPNIIGYARVVCSLTSFWLMMMIQQQRQQQQANSVNVNDDQKQQQQHEIDNDIDHAWIVAISLYIASFVGDLFDGMVARKLHQTSSFGGVLDMITDRCSTLGLLYILAEEYRSVDEASPSSSNIPLLPLYRILFLLLILLDMSSHWCQMYASLACGGQGQHHHKSETANASRNFLVRWFYKYYYFFGYLCVGAEFTYICLYAIRHVQAEQQPFLSIIVRMGLYGCAPGCMAKQVVNVAQLLSACHTIAAWDAQQRNDKEKEKETIKKDS
jgi:CDP-diacylglycerol--inositol 3-phosphatidyltransferase